MIVLGIVGTPAGGKSTVADILQQWGAEWINADLIARDCLNDANVLSALRNRFGAVIIGKDGKVDRTQMAKLVFGTDPVKRANLAYLESWVHPLTRTEIQRRIEQAAERQRPVALLDVPLLFESGWDRACDAIWCVDADHQIRLDRARLRGWDDDELDRREANQMPIETKSRLSNRVMRNDSTLESLRQNLRLCWDDLARIRESRGRPLDATSGRHCLSDRVGAPPKPLFE